MMKMNLPKNCPYILFWCIGIGLFITGCSPKSEEDKPLAPLDAPSADSVVIEPEDASQKAISSRLPEVVLTHPSMDQRPGYPAIIKPGEELPRLTITSASSGILEVSLIAKGSEIALQSPAPQTLKPNTPTNILFEGDLPPEGVYRIDLRILEDNQVTFRDAYSFSVLDPATLPANYSVVAHPGPDGSMRYLPDVRGNRIPDFSGVGYLGGKDLPIVPTVLTLSPEPGDNTERIQDAIDQVSARDPDSNGFRGAVELSAGLYEIGGSLYIRESGVVLRGAGPGDLRTPMLDPALGMTLDQWLQSVADTDATVLVATGPEHRPLLTIAGKSGISVNSKTSTEITDNIVPVGRRWFHVADPQHFKVGDSILLERRGNADWISHIKMDQIPPRPDGKPINQWEPFDLKYEYTITDIDADRITVDASLMVAVEQRWGGGRIRRYSEGGRIRKSGVENLRAVSFWQINQDGKDDTDHADQFVVFDRIRDGWASQVVAEHFTPNTKGMFKTERDSLGITMENCSALAGDPSFYFGEGYDSSGRYHQATGIYVGRYGFYFGGQKGLVRNCYALNNRHAFTAASRVSGPNVFSECTGEGSLTYSEPHHRWSVGGLYDSVFDKEIALHNRLNYGSGHGWAGANYVAWNCTADLTCEQPPTAQNWAIGNTGRKVDGPFHAWNLENYGVSYGYWESQNQQVAPASLYTQQRADQQARIKIAPEQNSPAASDGGFGPQNLTLLQPGRFEDARQAIASGQGPIAKAWPAQRKRADDILASGKDYSVTSNKTVLESGNPHDYYSIGPYWWPDPNSPDGLPYIRKDGQVNPERDLVSDRDALRGMISDVVTLAYTFALSGDQKYAARAAELLRVFFFEEATYMRPNLIHAQAIPGVTPGRGTGIIDTQEFTLLVDALLLLEDSEAWTADDATAMRQWMSAYLDWLLEHPNGHHERSAKNNHGTAFDLQTVSLALYTGRKDLARQIIEEDTKSRINSQIEADGRQPLELSRTRAWSYIGENLRHFTRLGLLARHVGADLFGYEAQSGGSRKAAIAFALPYVSNPESFTYQQVTEWDNVHFREVLHATVDLYPEMGESIQQALDHIGETKGETFFYLHFLRPMNGVKQ